MKICTINDDHYPSYWTSTHQVITTASYLGKIGVEVDFMIPRQGSMLLMNKEERLRKICEHYGVEPTFNLKDIFTVWPTNRFRIEKLTHGFVAPLLANFSPKNYDLIYTRHIIPVFITLAMGGKALFETYRLLPEEYPKTIPLLLKIAENPNFLGITTHSELSKQSFVDAGVPEEKVMALHNGYDPTEFEPVLTKQEARKLLGLNENKFTVVYTGHMTAIKGVEILIDIAELVPEADFLLVGGPTQSDIDRMQKIVDQKDLNNVKITGWVNPNKVPPYLYASDILIIPPTSKPLREHRRTVLPIKLFNYMAAGRVILAPDLPDTSELLHHGVNSYRVAADNPREAADAIHEIMDDPMFANGLAERSKRDSLNYTWEARAKKLKKFMENRLKAS